MVDLISRAALLKSLNEQAPKPTTDDLYTVNMCIINAPAVDAVPVEWLEYMQQECLSENDRTMVNAIEAILIEWHLYVHRLREMDRQKEQEAKNGKTD